MSDILFRFIARPGEAVSKTGEKLSCRIVYDGKVTAELYYGYRAEPLILSAEALPGDIIEIRIFSPVIRLYVNGTLFDEEWPAGERYLSDDPVFEGNLEIQVLPCPDEEKTPLRSGIPTSEIRLPGVHIGDCMPFSDDSGGDFHLFYLYDRHHHASKWKLGAHTWAHVSTRDLKTWEEYPKALDITEEWEGSICTGSVFASEENGRPVYYAWYAVRTLSRVPRPITYAKSYDLIHFEKSGESFFLPDVYDKFSARDPLVFYAKGKYHILVTTSRTSDGSGCLAHLSNEALSAAGWTDEGPIMAWADLVGIDDPTAKEQPECPDCFRMGDYYYLVFSIEGVARYGYSTDPCGGWIYPENNTVPCGAVPKSAVLPSTGERIFMGFLGEGDYAGALCAAKAKQNGDGTLAFESIELL